MRYKDVFLIWLFADLLLAVGATVLSFVGTQYREGDSGMVLLLIFMGLLFSLPSLIAMLIFHAIYSSNTKSSNYKVTYLLLILVINFLYWVIGTYVYDMHYKDYVYFILCTTAAGILAFFFVDRNIQKRLKEQQLSETTDPKDLISGNI